MHARTIVAQRWPALELDPARTASSTSSTQRERLVWKGQTMVSPLNPEREAKRLLEQAFPDGIPARVTLVGHGNGVLERLLLDAPVQVLRILVPDMAYLSCALDLWKDAEVLADPRVDLVAPGQELLPLDGEQLLDLPAIVRAFPGFCARTRVQLGQLRASERRLRIMVVEPVYGGSLPLARHAAEAFRALGHTVQSVSLDGMEQAHRTLLNAGDRHLKGRSLLSGFEELMGQLVLLEASRFRPDLVFALAQSPVSARVSEQLRQQGARTAFWFVEDFETMPYWKALHGHFDLFLTIQKGRFHEQLAALSGNPVRYLPLCSDPSVHFPEPGTPEESIPLSFVGAGYHNRQTAFLELRDHGLKIWGSDWNPLHPAFDMIQDGGRRTDEARNRWIFSNSRINLNLHSSTYHAGVDPDGDFVNPRVFDILACGGFQLVDQRSLLPELLVPGKHLATYRDTNELRDLVTWYLEHPGQAREMAEAGRREVLARHTFKVRMAEFLELAHQLGADWFPTAAPRKEAGLVAEADPELAAWLAQLPPDVDHTVSSIARHVSQLEGELGETERLFLYMGRIQEWARSKKIDQMLEGASRG